MNELHETRTCSLENVETTTRPKNEDKKENHKDHGRMRTNRRKNGRIEATSQHTKTPTHTIFAKTKHMEFGKPRQKQNKKKNPKNGTKNLLFFSDSLN